jgi:REP element-mobilizing transposase RayT
MYRRGALTGEHLDFLRGVFAKARTDFEAHLVEINDEDDHDNLLVACPSKVAASTLVRLTPA